ncbi:MAG TPA: hypothetical protein VL119_11520 [Acidimicrobiia bacterium]|nr:hypothetical protein [Acidimicrobiia bacterium]
MSPLAFDKQGKPFAWHRRTTQLLVRMFRNPAARGTCCQVLDGEGNPLYIAAETEYAEFRKAVGNVPGLYRLDQCDDDGVEIDDAQPAYVSIDLTRNASLTDDGEINPLIIIEHMFAIHADVMKTMATQQASIMAASAEILRAPFRPPAPAAERDAREEEDDNADDDEDELEPAPEPDPWAAWRPILKMVEPFLPKLGELLYEQIITMVKKSKSPPPAAGPNPPPVQAFAADGAASPSQSAESAGAAAGSSSPAPAAAASSQATSGKSGTPTPPAPSAESVTPAPAAETASATSASASAGATTAGSMKATTAAASVPATAATAPASASPASTGTALPVASSEQGPRNAALSPTAEQWEHLHEIRERLSPKERAIAENAIMRMDADVLTDYLAELATLSVDEAVVTIRSMIAKLRPTRGPERSE